MSVSARPKLQSKKSFDDFCLDHHEVYKSNTERANLPSIRSLDNDKSDDDDDDDFFSKKRDDTEQEKENSPSTPERDNLVTSSASHSKLAVKIDDSPIKIPSPPKTTSAVSSSSHFFSPQKKKRILQRQPSKDDMCIVKCEQNFIVNKVKHFKESFPSFNVFKSNVKKKKNDLLSKHMIDSELLYVLLENLSWSFSFNPEKRRMLTRNLLLDGTGVYNRTKIQETLQQEYNITIGNYEADNIVQYVSLYSLANVKCDTAALFADDEVDCVKSRFAHHKSENLPFSLLLPYDKTMEAWCDCIDRLTIRQLNEATNLEAANMSSGSFSTAKNSKDSKYMNVKEGMESDDSLTHRKITRQEVRDFRASAKSCRKNGAAVEISVFKESAKVIPLKESSSSDLSLKSE